MESFAVDLLAFGFAARLASCSKIWCKIREMDMGRIRVKVIANCINIDKHATVPCQEGSAGYDDLCMSYNMFRFRIMYALRF